MTGKRGADKVLAEAMSGDPLLSDDDVESALSVAYVHAVAAHAGYVCGQPPGPDRDSVDVQIAASGAMRPKIDVQLEASIRLAGSHDVFRYPLKVKNYDDLRNETQTPRLLVVLDLPRERGDWLTVSISERIIRRAAYWASLRGLPESGNSTSVTPSIPRADIFAVPALTGSMQKSRTGRIL